MPSIIAQTISTRKCLLVFITFLTLRTMGINGDIRSSYFLGEKGLKYVGCNYIQYLTRFTCVSKCQENSRCFGVNVIDIPLQPGNVICGICERGVAVAMSQNDLFTIFTKFNSIVQTHVRQFQFAHIPNGLRIGDVITISGVPDGTNFEIMFLDDFWNIWESPDGYRDSNIICDLSIKSYFDNTGDPRNTTFSSFDKEWTDLTSPVLFETSSYPYLEVGRKMTIRLLVKDENTYDVYSNKRLMSSFARNPAKKLNELTYLLVPPIITKVGWFDYTVSMAKLGSKIVYNFT